MRKLNDVETLVVRAMNAAIELGILLISGDWGVKWNADTSRWECDPELGVPSCDIFGALLLTQPALDPALHRGDYDRAVRMIMDGEFYTQTADPDLETLFEAPVYEFVRNVLNGWDGFDFLGGDEDAFLLGTKLAEMYRPLSSDVLEMGSQTRLRVVPSLDSFADDESTTDLEDEIEAPRNSEVRQLVAQPALLEFTELEASVG